MVSHLTYNVNQIVVERVYWLTVLILVLSCCFYYSFKCFSQLWYILVNHDLLKYDMIRRHTKWNFAERSIQKLVNNSHVVESLNMFMCMIDSKNCFWVRMHYMIWVLFYYFGHHWSHHWFTIQFSRLYNTV